MNNQLGRPSMAEMAAGILAGTATSKGRSVTAPLSARLPVFVLAELEAMAAKSGKSRNAVLTMVLEVGLDAIGKELDDATATELRRIQSETLRRLLPDGTDEEEA